MIFYNKPLDQLSKELLKLINEADSFDGLTIAEIQNRTGINHPQKIYNRLNILIRGGYITEDFEIIKFPEENKLFLPFFGWAQCGNNGDKVFDEYPRKRIELDNNLSSQNYNDFFITRAKGKSMEPKIKTGQNLLVKKYNGNISDNTIYLVSHNERAKVKQIYTQGNKVFLHSLNPDYPDLEVRKDDNFQIIGNIEIIDFKI